MQYILLATSLVSLAILIIIIIRLSKSGSDAKTLNAIEEGLRRMEQSIAVTNTRLEELGKAYDRFNSMIDSRLMQFSTGNERLTKTVEEKLDQIRNDNERRLEQMRKTVEEKLQSTLESRLSTSFKQVGDQLESVYKQLGEMQNLAQGVGNLEKVLTNVKTRGMWGELQAERILQEILLPEQYLKNVVTKRTGRDPVEFAVRLPGASEGEHVLLPIDSKFPREDYEKLCTATESGDVDAVKILRKAL